MSEDAVTAAMVAIERRRFLPPSKRHLAGLDRPVRIGHQATNSQPTTVRRMLALLDVHAGHRVLDVGAGSGWTTALLAHLVGPGGCVVGVELDPDLAAWAERNVRGLGLPWAQVHAAQEDVLGWPADGPYHRILVSAEAQEIPDQLVDQLDVDGLMVVPVRGEMMRVRKRSDGVIDVSRHGAYSFVPLP